MGCEAKGRYPTAQSSGPVNQEVNLEAKKHICRGSDSYLTEWAPSLGSLYTFIQTLWSVSTDAVLKWQALK